MAEELRKIYNETFIYELFSEIKKEYSSFDGEKCNSRILQIDWDQLALKERMRRITTSLHRTLPNEYKTAIEILYKVAPKFTGLKGIIFPDYVEFYGQEEWDESMKELVFFTLFSTSEFAVGHFLIKDLERMLTKMIKWSVHPDEHVRWLASEEQTTADIWSISPFH